MASERAATEAGEAEDFPARVCDLLSRQVRCAHETDLAEVERLGVEVDGVIAEMRDDPAGRHRFTEPQWRQVERLHDELALTLRAEQANVKARLTRLRQVKRVVGKYRGRPGRP